MEATDRPTPLDVARGSRVVVVGAGLIALGLLFAGMAAVEWVRGEFSSYSKGNLWLSAIFAAAGGPMLYVGWRRAQETARIAHDGQPADAIVTAVKRSRLQLNGYHIVPESESTWVIRYEYTDPFGRTHVGRTGLLSWSEAAVWRAGDRALVRIDPDRPQRSVWVGRASS